MTRGWTPHHAKQLSVAGLLHCLLGYATFLRPIKRSAILNFHSVRDIADAEAFEWTRSLTVSPGFLEQLIRELRRHDVTIVSLAELLSRLDNDGSGPLAAITLDDGYADNFHFAYPIFKQHDVPFTLFLPSGFIDRTMPMWWSFLEIIVRDYDCLTLPHRELPARTFAEKNTALSIGLQFFRAMKPAEITRAVNEITASYGGALAAEASARPLTWSMVKSMMQSGLATMGCHSANHPAFSNLERNAIAGEIRLARDRLAAELGSHPQFFAYPYGGNAEIGGEAPAVVAELGFQAAFTTRRATLKKADLAKRYLLPRITMSGKYQHRATLSAYFFMAEHGW